MKIVEIKENILREDKLMVAVSCECSEVHINDVLAGRRNSNTELGKQIISELSRLAEINKKWRAEKNISTPINELA